ncbi:class I SAM-dependent methyltransferase [Microbulbifer sp. MLAF003]|uniref:class I SAM-dependent methyltransferase n=1 Tax=Microbulbifer sp. MLAF003 TaxID=3032582 RepID=UPI0024ADF5D5|nr:class I SAM-dependent methyltransferase [Microbulbifer sp. MLAF003]WHI49903.1 class I SAM-dependent methyltransferase [Microbulbifer sp. MLAF003]
MSTNWQQLLELVESKIAQGGRDSRRLFHGRGRCYEGLEQVCVDSFFPALLVTFSKSMKEKRSCAKRSGNWQSRTITVVLLLSAATRLVPR